MRRSWMPMAFVVVTIAVTAVAAPSATTATEKVLTPGSSELTTDHLRTSAVSYRYLSRKPTGDTTEREAGAGRTEQVLTQHEGKPAVLLVSTSQGKDWQYVDTSLVMQSGLAPVWEVSRFKSRVTRYDYAGKQVRLTVTTPDSGTKTREHSYDVPVFHFSELDVLLRSLPLREGYEAIVPLYSEGSDELEMDSVRVQSRARDGVWTVRFADPAIVATYGINGTTREIVTEEIAQRKSGAHVRRVLMQ